MTTKVSTFHRIFSIDQLEGRKAVESNFITPFNLAITRTIWAVFCIITVIIKLVDNAHTPINYILYLTNISFFAITAYMIISTFLSWRYVCQPTREPWSNSHWMIKFSYFILYQSCILLSLIVTLVYWALLAKDELSKFETEFGLYLSIAMHAGNSIMTCADAVLSRNPVILLHLPIVLSLALLYLPYAILLRHITGKWPYFFLNYEESPLLFAGVILGIIVTSILFHYLLYRLHLVRDRYHQPSSTSSQIIVIETKELCYA